MIYIKIKAYAIKKAVETKPSYLNLKKNTLIYSPVMKRSIRSWWKLWAVWWPFPDPLCTNLCQDIVSWASLFLPARNSPSWTTTRSFSLHSRFPVLKTSTSPEQHHYTDRSCFWQLCLPWQWWNVCRFVLQRSWAQAASLFSTFLPQTTTSKVLICPRLCQMFKILTNYLTQIKSWWFQTYSVLGKLH